MKISKCYGRNPMYGCGLPNPKPQIILLENGTYLILRPDGTYEVAE